MNASPPFDAFPRARRAAGAAVLALLAAAPFAAGAQVAGPADTAVPGEAAAPAMEAVPVAGQRSFGLGPTIGFWSGAGAIAGGGGETVKAWVSGGYAPVLVFSNARTADKAMRFNYYSAYQLNGDVTVRLMRRARAELGLLLGYKYNSVIGHGGGAGARLLYDLSARTALEISGGLAVFPSAQDRLDRRGYPSDRVPGITPALQGGVGVGLLVFP